MANLKDIRDRIKSVRSIQKVTKAMKMVAAAKMRRAQERMEQARPYSNSLSEVIEHLLPDIDRERLPLLNLRERKRKAYVVVCADRGLAGAFNTNLLKIAQKEIDDLAEKWQKDVEKKYNEIQSKYKSFQEEEILLPEETKKIRLDEIMELEVKAKELQKKRFGVEGDLFKKRKELIEPIQDKIYKAVKELSKDNNYSFILDKSKNSNIIYADPKYDKSDAVLRKINN